MGLSFSSDGTAAGLGLSSLGSQTISVSGGVYNYAVAGLGTTNVDLGNIHVGNSFGTSALSITNTAAAGSYTEGLNAAAAPGGLGNKASVSGTIINLAGGAVSTNIAVGLDNGSVLDGGVYDTAGLVTGSVNVGFVSSGSNSGLSNSILGSQNVSVTGGVYNYAAAGLTTNVDLGNVHVGGTFNSTGVAITNTAAASYSDVLNGSVDSFSGATATGSISGVTGQTSSSAITVGITGTQSSAGAKSGTVGLSFSSDGTAAGLGLSSLGSQTLNVSGGVYNYAVAGLTTSVNLGNVHVGETFSSTGVAITNTAAASYSDVLNGSVVSYSGATGTGSISGVAGQSSSSAITVGITGTQSSAGAKSGTVGLSFSSDGTAAGLGLSSLGSQTISVSGGVYNFAVAGLGTTSVDLGNIHVGNSFGTSALSITNTAAAGSYTEGLDVAAEPVVAGDKATASGTINNLAGGAVSTNISVGLGNGSVLGGDVYNTAGQVNGSVKVGFVSSGINSGLSNTVLGSQTVTVTGGVYNYAAAGFGTTSVDLGNIHAGGSFNTNYLCVTNTASGANGYVETLAASFANPSGVSTIGSVSGLTNGSSSSALGVTITDSTAGAKSGTTGVAFTSQAIASGLSDSSLGSSSITVSGFVYTGQGVWNAGSGSWTNFANWQQAGGTPGLDGALSINDTATFGTGVGGTIALNGASPSISSLTFSNASASYVVAQGSGGSVSLLAAESNPASINTLAGSHSISAPLVLGSDVTFYGESASLLSVSGVVSGSGALIQSGSGTLALTGVNTYSGGTLVSEGTLSGNACSIQGSVTNNATVVFNQSSAGTYSGNMSGIGALVVSGNGGALTLSGNNSYLGGTLINSGASVIGNTASLTGDIANNGALTFHNGSIGSYDGVISGTGSLSVSGSAAVTLNAASTYTGATEISNGATLALGASGSLLNSSEIKLGTLQQPGTLDLTSKSAYEIGVGQTLCGSGTVSMASGGTINLNGTVTPGFTSPGIQSFNGNVVFGNSATTTMVVDGGSNGTTANSSVNATGSITYAGGLLIQTTSSFWSLPDGPYTFNLFAAGTQSGVLSSICLNGAFTGSFNYNSGSNDWTLQDSGGHNWDFNQLNGTLAVTVPEPSTYALMAIGAGMLLITAIRRRRANS